MDDFSEAFESTKTQCDAIEAKYGESEVAASITAFSEAAEQVGKAWSGSWFGYHSRVYYNNLQPVPAGARFSQEWGFLDRRFSSGTVGEWDEFEFDVVYKAITGIDTPTTIDELQQLASGCKDELDEMRENLISIVESALANGDDPYLERLKKDIEGCLAHTASDFVNYLRPSGKFFSRDMVALQAGLQTPPHICVQAEIFAIESPKKSTISLRKAAGRLSQHLSNKSRAHIQKITPGTHVFIGHGRSHLWKDLKDFINDRMELPWDEFNRVPVAGVTNIARLSEMLKSAAIAFIVMTAEDEQADGKVRARMNVIHEAGLFQGRLGFTRAIVVLESGCEEFSNIQGLGQIRFPEGNIKACFEEIRQVLEREGLA